MRTSENANLLGSPVLASLAEVPAEPNDLVAELLALLIVHELVPETLLEGAKLTFIGGLYGRLRCVHRVTSCWDGSRGVAAPAGPFLFMSPF